MRSIKGIVEDIREELEGAEKYAKRAAHNKGSDDGLAAMYAEMAQQELTHADKLHGRAVEMIKKHRMEHGEPPAAMLAVWEWEHEKMNEQAAKIKSMIDMARK